MTRKCSGSRSMYIAPWIVAMSSNGNEDVCTMLRMTVFGLSFGSLDTTATLGKLPIGGQLSCGTSAWTSASSSL